ncbi:hypothetical protein [Pseudomonas sp. RGM 3321]|uniref:hypothetical protein n=1 Tax=Pseudomonas sp. RGM 3321 TaxID=2930089 RepID=UPI001FCA824A|nr:hypothetical protein [Pseudomonas sp. RGM 3321]MCJ2372466.1 hypothetical protein [Pseudomonas sp. RGM 3321]
MNLPLTAPTRTARHSLDGEIYPPRLSATTQELAHELLQPLDDGLDLKAARLTYVDSKILPGEEQLLNSALLIPSLIDHFTGRLSWTEHDAQALALPATAMQSSSTEPLGRVAVLTLYAQVNQQLEQRHSQKLADYWSVTLPDGKTRSSVFISDKAQCLKSECEIQISKKQMTTSHYGMLSAALNLCSPHTLDEVQPHSVYSISASMVGSESAGLPGAFAITRTCHAQTAQTDLEEKDDVLLYTLQDGLEEFSSFKQLNDRLALRSNDIRYRRCLKNPSAPDSPGISPLQWQYTPMQGNFLALLLSRQIVRQQSLFAQAARLARARRMDSAQFEQHIWFLLEPDLHFDNNARLSQMDDALIQNHKPDWWSTMTPLQHEEWLTHARRFGKSVADLQRSSKNQFGPADIDSRFYVARYIDRQLNDALTKAGVSVPPDQILVSLSYRVETKSSDIFNAPIPTTIEDTTMSLRQLVHTRAHRITAQDAMQIRVADNTGLAIAGLNMRFVKDLVTAISDLQHLDRYLDLHLKTSAYARQLKHLHRKMLEAQMNMALLEIEQQGFSPKGREWIKAVLESPAPQGRRAINGEAIEIRFFNVNKFKMTNIMLIAPAEKFEKGPLILCTLNASDGVVFRWFDSMFHLTTHFLEETPFQQYMIRQILVSRRLEALYAMQYEKEAKHWRPPEIFTRLSPIPIPERLLRPVIFISQTKDFYEENHESTINHLINEARQQMGLARNEENSGVGFDLVASIAILFLPYPIMMPLALGLGLYKTWSAFSKIDENDIQGAAEEFLDAISYLAIAATGRLTYALRPVIHASVAVRRPHLIRRIGRDGQVQIGYLMSHSNAPRLAESRVIVALDSKRFVAIEIEAQTCYVSRRANIFGHSRLYRVHPTDATQLVHEQEFALRTTRGTWKTVGNEIPRISRQAAREANARLSSWLADWPTATGSVSAADQLRFEADCLALSKTSNAEDFPEIVAYVEGGSADINPLLRSGVRNTTTRNFLHEFHQLREWRGGAFRATYVSSEGMARLEREAGAVFTNNGVQSASISRSNAVGWSNDGFVRSNASAGNHPVFFIFDPDIPKKNMFTGFLADHVAIAPGTRLQLGATQRLNDQFFAYFTVPEQVVDSTYDLYTGEQEHWV